jgi:hypothetical protein
MVLSSYLIGIPRTSSSVIVEYYGPESLQEKVERYAKLYDVPSGEIAETIDCETGGTWDTTIRSGHTLSYGQERSYGLAQIHLPSHPDVSHEEATDPDFAIEFMAKHWDTHKSWWVCARKLGLTN